MTSIFELLFVGFFSLFCALGTAISFLTDCSILGLPNLRAFFFELRPALLLGFSLPLSSLNRGLLLLQSGVVLLARLDVALQSVDLGIQN